MEEYMIEGHKGLMMELCEDQFIIDKHGTFEEYVKEVMGDWWWDRE